MNSTTARLDLLSATVRAIAASLPRERADQVAHAVREHAAEAAAEPLTENADEALAADLLGLLAALDRPVTGYRAPC